MNAHLNVCVVPTALVAFCGCSNRIGFKCRRPVENEMVVKQRAIKEYHQLIRMWHVITLNTKLCGMIDASMQIAHLTHICTGICSH